MKSMLLQLAELLVIWTVLSIAVAVAASRILRRLRKKLPSEAPEQDIVEETGEVHEPHAIQQDDAIERLWAAVRDEVAFEREMVEQGLIERKESEELR